MREYRINGNAFVQAPALFARGKELYAQCGLVASYELVYTMFPDIPMGIVERILNGDITAFSRGNCVIYFLEEETNHG